MKIDVSDGSIFFADGTINPRLDKRAFLATRIGATSKETLINKNWVNLEISPEPGVVGTAIFDDERLWGLLLCIRLPSDDTRQWNIEREHERKVKHDEWLRAELGSPPYQYGWGEIASEFDPRGGISEIVVRYAN
jgi:hypothetical protein